ncbi:hypothetical protein B0H21DRAFT_890600 [Amylocystis lapponica]|nr:hypothetical protein B0H21DRAFT_890600 [Amylocystis lapponica]
MHSKFVKTTYDDFMQFVPAVNPSIEEWEDAFNGITVGMSEADLQDTVVRIVNEKKMCGEKHIAVSTQYAANATDPSKRKSDCGIYATAQAPSDDRSNLFTQRLTLVFKETDCHDPFSSSKTNFDQENHDQIIQYISEIFLRQQRCFHFSVIILGTYARLVRWDRSGAIVSEKFDYSAEPWMLADFLWQFSNCSTEQQGDDITATLVVPGSQDYQDMDDVSKTPLGHNDYIRQFFSDSLDVEWPRWKLAVYDESEPRSVDDDTDSGRTSSGKAVRHFLVCKPHFHASGMYGRGTRGYVALDCETKELVYLKDVWRIDLNGIRKEGVVLQELNQKHVRNVPTLCCHGDVPNQCSETWRYWWGQPESNPMQRYTHYRLVEHEVGRPLKDFNSSAAFFKVLLDCLRAHEDAYINAHILHCDISSGNLLLTYRVIRGHLVPCGLLNDWELSKVVPGNPDEQQKANNSSRMGTWQFMSVRSLNAPKKPIVLQDDLEAFFHVMLYYAIRFFRSNCDDVASFINAYFDASTSHNGQHVCGSMKNIAMQVGWIEIWSGWRRIKLLRFSSVLRKLEPSTPDDTQATSSEPPIAQQDSSSSKSGAVLLERHPLDIAISVMLSWFSAYYIQLNAASRPQKTPPNPVRPPRTPDPSLEDSDLFDLEDDLCPGDVGGTADHTGPPDVAHNEALKSDLKAWKAEAAATLNSHMAMCELLKYYGRQCSGLNDKIEDRLCPAKSKSPACGLKRGREADETASRSNKRVKSSHE